MYGKGPNRPYSHEAAEHYAKFDTDPSFLRQGGVPSAPVAATKAMREKSAEQEEYSSRGPGKPTQGRWKRRRYAKPTSEKFCTDFCVTPCVNAYLFLYLKMLLSSNRDFFEKFISFLKNFFKSYLYG